MDADLDLVAVWVPQLPAGFLGYSVVAVALIVYLIYWVAPEHGTDNVLVYIGICSLAGSFTVASCKVRSFWWHSSSQC